MLALWNALERFIPGPGPAQEFPADHLPRFGWRSERGRHLRLSRP